MTIYILKEIISTKYNRSDEERFNRSIAFVIQNTTNGNLALFQLDRIAKKVAALRCNNRSCGHRLSIEHTIPTEAYGKYKGRKIASEVTKADLLDSKNWLKVYHDHYHDHITIIAGLPQLLNDIGLANPSEFTLEQIPSDFMYLATIFD